MANVLKKDEYIHCLFFRLNKFKKATNHLHYYALHLKHEEINATSVFNSVNKISLSSKLSNANGTQMEEQRDY